MPPNPFPTLKDWQDDKKQFGIPGKVIKNGQFGEKVDKLQKAYISAGGAQVDLTNAAKVQQVLDQGATLIDEWLKKAKTLKAGDFKNKNGAIDLVTGYRRRIEAVSARVRQTIDPLHEPRTGIKQAIAMYRKAVSGNPDYRELMELWDSGARQYVGQGFKIAAKNAATLGYNPAVVNQLNQYDQIVSKWMDTMLNGDDAKREMADADKREEFMNDMHQAFAIATNVLKATAG
jgi:hypothetical protein